MISTYQALVVALLALLPGASYTFAVERMIGSYGVNFSDRLVRFLAASAIFHAIASGPEYLLYKNYIVGGKLLNGNTAWWGMELLALLYVFVPIGVGVFLGLARRRRWPLGRLIVGERNEPRAWDFLWEKDRGVVRLKLKSGVWLAGVYGTTTDRRSYASGYPTDDSDLYLADALSIDPVTGVFERDNEQQPVYLDGRPGLLIKWADIEYLEFQEF